MKIVNKLHSVTFFLEQLNDDVKEKALINFNNRFKNKKKYNDVFVCSIQEAISVAFEWNETPEGFIYWSNILNNYNHATHI